LGMIDWRLSLPETRVFAPSHKGRSWKKSHIFPIKDQWRCPILKALVRNATTCGGWWLMGSKENRKCHLSVVSIPTLN
jgi:hypothetical protein